MLSVRLRKRLPEFDLDVALDVEAETVVLIGRSGCGKTTTLSAIAGLVEPDAGSIALGGRSLFRHPPYANVPPESRRVAYVLQHYALFPHLSVERNIAYGLSRSSRAERAARVAEVAVLLDIGSLLQASPQELSGGERQRVALARALVTRPAALLLDEPLAALDVATRSKIRRELRALLRGLAIPTVVVSHDYDDARVLADRIAVMERGRIVQVDVPAELAARPATAFVAEFVGTNYVRADGGAIAFAPWHVALTRAPVEAGYRWRCRVVELTRYGSLVRVHLDGEAAIVADVIAEESGSEPFEVGESVHASVALRHVRVLPHEPMGVPR